MPIGCAAMRSGACGGRVDAETEPPVISSYRCHVKGTSIVSRWVSYQVIADSGEENTRSGIRAAISARVSGPRCACSTRLEAESLFAQFTILWLTFSYSYSHNFQTLCNTSGAVGSTPYFQKRGLWINSCCCSFRFIFLFIRSSRLLENANQTILQTTGRPPGDHQDPAKGSPGDDLQLTARELSRGRVWSVSGVPRGTLLVIS